MEVCTNFLETTRLETLMSPSDKSDISASSSLRSSPDGVEESSSRSNSESMEEVWSDDVETAFYEALEVFPGNNNKKRIRMADGKVYGKILIFKSRQESQKRIFSYKKFQTKSLSPNTLTTRLYVQIIGPGSIPLESKKI